jgi:hypothetical protein
VRKPSKFIRVPKSPWTIGIGVNSAATKDEIEACRSFFASALPVFRGDCERLLDKTFHGSIVIDSAIVPSDEAGTGGSPNAMVVVFFLGCKLRFLKPAQKRVIEEKLRQISFELLERVRAVWGGVRSDFDNNLPDVTFEVDRWFFSLNRDQDWPKNIGIGRFPST